LAWNAVLITRYRATKDNGAGSGRQLPALGSATAWQERWDIRHCCHEIGSARLGRMRTVLIILFDGDQRC
jgi:hypothetical protein